MNMAGPTPLAPYFQGYWNTNEEQTSQVEEPVFKASQSTNVNTRLMVWLLACFLIAVRFHVQNLGISSRENRF